jgi:hypothetical protein
MYKTWLARPEKIHVDLWHRPSGKRIDWALPSADEAEAQVFN